MYVIVPLATLAEIRLKRVSNSLICKFNSAILAVYSSILSSFSEFVSSLPSESAASAPSAPGRSFETTIVENSQVRSYMLYAHLMKPLVELIKENKLKDTFQNIWY